ncbi:hypothetical protein KIPB_014836 [Kipferlia bialata]|uniref:Uncharacterized protein n=1 Tax=Kipferlia bialata TaxID=797122 RepID=A0A391P0D6_9EUKA|nr:hypothetical protein KIPB_014836 [Kipferlia bialata]|eukprot:g14836.t1
MSEERGGGPMGGMGEHPAEESEEMEAEAGPQIVEAADAERDAEDTGDSEESEGSSSESSSDDGLRIDSAALDVPVEQTVIAEVRDVL